jgi:Tol biopolymer transport system component
MGKKLLVALFALLVATLASPAAPSAEATPPGHNGRIAFRRFLNADKSWGAVFTIDPNGSRERQITHPPQGYVDTNPDVSPDGRRIAFQREGVDCDVDCAYHEIFVVNSDGSHLARLTTQPSPQASCGHEGFCNQSPAWSPDGRRIAFSRASGPVEEENMGLYVMAADGSHVRQVTQLVRPGIAADHDPQWSPNGASLVFERDNVRSTVPTDGIALWVLNLKSGGERRITAYELRAGDTPDWSPDGRHILFHDNVDGPPGISANLYTVRPDGTGLHQLTFATGGVVQYLGSSYSPDGTMITFGRRPATGGTEANAADVFIMRVDGSHERPVTRTDLYDSYPDWGPTPCGLAHGV